MIRDLVGLMVTDMLQASDICLQESNVISAIESQNLKNIIIYYIEDRLHCNRELKDFLFIKPYRHYRVVRMQVKAEHTITDLFNDFFSEPVILPVHVQ